MCTLTSVETGNFKMLADILGTVEWLSKLGIFGSYDFMVLLPQKIARGEFQKTWQPSKMSHLMQIRMHMVWEYFSTSLVGVGGWVGVG